MVRLHPPNHFCGTVGHSRSVACHLFTVHCAAGGFYMPRSSARAPVDVGRTDAVFSWA